jgi:hypothetical protein
MSEAGRRFVVTIQEAGKASATRIDASGVVVLTEVQRGHFQMSLRGVDTADLVMACAQFMKYATELHPGFPGALEIAVENLDAMPSIGEIRQA